MPLAIADRLDHSRSRSPRRRVDPESTAQHQSRYNILNILEQLDKAVKRTVDDNEDKDYQIQALKNEIKAMNLAPSGELSKGHEWFLRKQTTEGHRRETKLEEANTQLQDANIRGHVREHKLEEGILYHGRRAERAERQAERRASVPEVKRPGVFT